MNRIAAMTVVLLIAVLSAGTAQAQSDSIIVGHWMDKKEGARRIEFFRAEDGFYYGRTLADSAFQGKVAVKPGTVVFRKLQFDAITNTYTGTMNPPGAGIEIAATVSFAGNDEAIIVGKKFAMKRTMTFVRID